MSESPGPPSHQSPKERYTLFIKVAATIVGVVLLTTVAVFSVNAYVVVTVYEFGEASTAARYLAPRDVSMGREYERWKRRYPEQGVEVSISWYCGLLRHRFGIH